MWETVVDPWIATVPGLEIDQTRPMNSECHFAVNVDSPDLGGAGQGGRLGGAGLEPPSGAVTAAVGIKVEVAGSSQGRGERGRLSGAGFAPPSEAVTEATTKPQNSNQL